MPLSIAAGAWLGWWVVGLAPATALLFGAALAPTDPVLANDVQTGPPTTGRHDDTDEPDEIRFALTSESSLNDGLAFPFTYLAILIASRGLDPTGWASLWLVRDVVYRIAIGVLVGWIIGWLLGRLVLRLVAPSGPLAPSTGGRPAPALLALAITLVSYGVTELLLGYGFIAVFVTAYVVRDTERSNHIHDHLHEGAEQLERLALGVVLLLVGALLADGLWGAITPPMVAVALLFVAVARPLAGWVGLLGDRRLTRSERAVVSVFGIRGLGSIYYLAYGLNHADFADAGQLWALTVTVILTSLVLHGVAARPVMRWADRRRELAAPEPAG